MEKYPKEVDAFLSGVRDATQPGTEDRARIHRALSKTLMHHGFNPPAAAPTAAGSRGSEPGQASSLVTPSLAIRLAAVALTTGALLAVWHFVSVPSSGKQAAKRPAPALAAPGRPSAELAPPARTNALPPPASVPVLAVQVRPAAELRPQAIASSEPSVARKYRAARPAPSAEGGSRLAEEIALIAEARTELEGGHADLALASLGRHAQRFERGALSDERRGLRALALCRLGRFAEGVAARDRFLQSSSNPMLAAQVRAACAGAAEQGGR